MCIGGGVFNRALLDVGRFYVEFLFYFIGCWCVGGLVWFSEYMVLTSMVDVSCGFIDMCTVDMLRV